MNHVSLNVLAVALSLSVISLVAINNPVHAGGLTDAERAEIQALMKKTDVLLKKNDDTLNTGYDRINQQGDKVNASFDTLNRKLEENNSLGRQRINNTGRQPENYTNWRRPL